MQTAVREDNTVSSEASFAPWSKWELFGVCVLGCFLLHSFKKFNSKHDMLQVIISVLPGLEIFLKKGTKGRVLSAQSLKIKVNAVLFIMWSMNQ